MVDIIIRAKNGHGLTAQCISSILANTDISKIRIILVDDGSETPWHEGDERPPVDVLVRHESPKGAVTATNSGLGIALQHPHPYVLILDNDTRVPDGDTDWLDRMIRELEDAGPACACVGATSSFVNPPQHIMTAPQTYTADWKEDDKKFGVKDNPKVVWFVSFAVLFHKRVLKELGPWDERYNPGNYEDTDYAMLCRRSGYEIKVARSVYIHHEGHATFGDQMSELMETNKTKFVQKWGPGHLWDHGMLQTPELHGLTKAIMIREGKL